MFEIFKKYPDLIVAVSEKKDGTMRLTGDVLYDKKMVKNRERFLKKFGISDELVVRAGLVHGNRVHPVSSQEAGKIIEKTDGLITADKNLFLTITVADCLPIFIYDPENEIVGLVHGGWRNLAGNILALTIKKMTENFGSISGDILAGIGPGISQCHFEVKEDLLREFKILDCKRPLQKSSDRTIFGSTLAADALLEKDGKYFLDLKKIAKIQLMNLGVKEENIEISPECTFCLKDKYFSFRREMPKIPQTMMAVIGRK